jgi:hypothetical protein
VFPLTHQILQFFRHEEAEAEECFEIDRNAAEPFVVRQNESDFLRGFTFHRDHLSRIASRFPAIRGRHHPAAARL